MRTKLFTIVATALAAFTAIYVFQPKVTSTDTVSNTTAKISVTSDAIPMQQNSTFTHSGNRLSSPQTQELSAETETDANTSNTTLDRRWLCQPSTEKNCTLRSDIDLSHAFAASPTQLDGNNIYLALSSTNFVQLHQLLSQASVSQEALLRQAEYQAAFNDFYQEAPGLMSNTLTCSDEICAASFNVTDPDSAQQISAAMDKFTANINAHSFSSQERDSADNVEVKLIFSNSAAFETVVH